MRSYAALIASVLLLSGCSGFDRFLDDTVRLPGSNPEAPKGNSENMMRVRGEMVASTPILPQGENIWPSRPPALPTLSDVANDDSFSLSDYSRASGADVDVVTKERGTDRTLPSDFPEDGNLNEGESNLIKNGASGNKMNSLPLRRGGVLPDHIEDHAPKYIEKNTNSQPIVIPNGDGTSTMITSTGTVTIVKDSEIAKHKGGVKTLKNLSPSKTTPSESEKANKK
ncbi:hypothetical protein [Commensalibacter oyaizuii]|uniref:DUF3035 domain-containing protein n=1 Tax=Commensalibacter oyaizuii TaxID=3043873 RepID=A0ABT6PZT3_9PROT|nr:hypothetical protein [Commensalibacter sp. TBRC 16381]MDI2090228.1 hypothetical protein [Commensalibacter sp. TBRC 16381]